MMQTQETKSLLPSHYKREEFPLFGKEGPFDTAYGHELVEWLGEIFRTICLLNDGLISRSN